MIYREDRRLADDIFHVPVLHLTNRVHVAVLLLLDRRNQLVLYNKETNHYSKAFFISKSFNITRKPAFAHFGEHEQNEAIWLVAKNCDLFRKITPLSNLTRVSLLVEWKLTAKAELNCEIYKSYTHFWCYVHRRHLSTIFRHAIFWHAMKDR